VGRTLEERLKGMQGLCLKGEVEGGRFVELDPPKGRGKVFTFSGDKLEVARGRLRGVEGVDGAAVSVNNLLTGIIWACFARARVARRGESVIRDGERGVKSNMGFAVNGRKHFKGEMAGRPYIGNVNLFGLVEMEVGMLKGTGEHCRAGERGVEGLEGLVPVVRVIHEAIQRVTAEYIAEVMEVMERVEDVKDVVPNWVRSNGMDLSVTSWANMGVYESDFGEGVGNPVFMRVPNFETDGLVIVMPRRRQKRGEGIEVVVLLCEDDLRLLEEDEIWRSWLV
jgi:hypothetical protein